VPKTALKVDKVEEKAGVYGLKLYLRDDFYKWFSDGPSISFRASNGFTIHSDKSCCSRYNSSDSAIWLSKTCSGQQVDLKDNLSESDFRNLMHDVDKFEVALKEMKECFFKEKHSKDEEKTLNFSDWAVL
jgi:hypothetical protein